MLDDPSIAELFGTFREVRDEDGRLIANQGLPLYVKQEFVDGLAAVFSAERVLPLESKSSVKHRGVVFETDLEDFVPSTPSAGHVSFFRDHYPSIVTRSFDPAARIASPEEVDRSEGLILFHTPRTGSHYLQSIIAAVDGFGPTEEWIRPPIISACRLGITDLYSHLQNCIALQLPRVRKWSLTVDCRALQQQWKSLAAKDQRQVLALMSRAHCFILTRGDRVAQAWSDVRAISTGVFFELVDDESQPEQPALASWDQYWFWVGLLIRQNIEAENWLAGMLAENGLFAPVVAYEDILSDEGLNRNIAAILGSDAGSAPLDLKTASTRFRRQLTYQDIGMIVKLRACIDDEKTLYPASPCRLGLLGDAVNAKDAIIIRPPFAGIVAQPRLLTGGILRIDFALPAAWRKGNP